MFENIIRQRQTLMGFNDKLLRKGLSETFENHEWEELEALTNFLQVFKEATAKLSGVYYPTSSLVLQQLYLMTEKISEFANSNTYMFRKTVYYIRKKLRKYFSTLPPVFCCAAALDPCLNFNGMELLMETILVNLDCVYGPEGDCNNFISNQKNDFNRTFDELFEIYATKYGRQANPIVDQFESGSSHRRPRDLNISLFNQLREDATKRQRTSTPTSELGNYKLTNFVLSSLTPEQFHNFDILGWWKTKEDTYPILAAMARDLLAVQASTVASESAFSTSGRIISERRSRLTPEAVEVCVCLKDYLDGVDRIQHATSLECPLGEDVEDCIMREEQQAGISPPTTESNTETELEDGEFDPFDIEENINRMSDHFLDDDQDE